MSGTSLDGIDAVLADLPDVRFVLEIGPDYDAPPEERFRLIAEGWCWQARCN